MKPKLQPPGSDHLHWAVVVHCLNQEPSVQDWCETQTEANARALTILETAQEEDWGLTTVWVMRIERQGTVGEP